VPGVPGPCATAESEGTQPKKKVKKSEQNIPETSISINTHSIFRHDEWSMHVWSKLLAAS